MGRIPTRRHAFRRRSLALYCALALCASIAAPARGADPTWVPSFPLQQQGRVYLSLFEDGGAYALRVEGGGGLFLKSTDFGATWAPIELPPVASTPRMDFGSTEVGYVAAGNDLWVTKDGAATWARLPRLTKDMVSFETVDVADGGRTVALTAVLWGNDKGKAWRSGDCHDPRYDRIVSYVSTDAGATWTEGTVAKYPSGVFDADFLDARRGILTLDSKTDYQKDQGWCSFGGSGLVGLTIMATKNGGKTWRKVLDCPEPAGCMAVSIASRRQLATVTTDGRVLVSWNGGRTFSTTTLDGVVEAPTRDHLRFGQGLEFVNERVGYVSTNGRGIWRTDDGGESWRREVSLHEVPGYAFGTIAASDIAHAIAGGPNFLIRRIP